MTVGKPKLGAILFLAAFLFAQVGNADIIVIDEQLSISQKYERDREQKRQEYQKAVNKNPCDYFAETAAELARLEAKDAPLVYRTTLGASWGDLGDYITDMANEGYKHAGPKTEVSIRQLEETYALRAYRHCASWGVNGTGEPVVHTHAELVDIVAAEDAQKKSQRYAAAQARKAERVNWLPYIALVALLGFALYVRATWQNG